MSTTSKIDPKTNSPATTATLATNPQGTGESEQGCSQRSQSSQGERIDPRSERNSRRFALATTATLATNPQRERTVATLLELCADLGVAPTDACARVSVSELAQLASGTATDAVLMRFSQAVGKARARGTV
jgi:hypothetical protein